MAVQWLGLHAVTAEGQFQFLIKELKSHNQHTTATHPTSKHTHTKKLLCKGKEWSSRKILFLKALMHD